MKPNKEQNNKKKTETEIDMENMKIRKCKTKKKYTK